MSDQLTLGECKPGQIIVFPQWNQTRLYRVRKQYNGVTRFMAMDDYTQTKLIASYPCRLATQADLDELAERIKRAND